MPNIEEITYDTKESVRNEYDFRRELLSALKEDFSSNNEVKDTESYRQHILHALGQEFDQDDIKQTNNFRAKVVDGVKELVNGGGGGGSYSSAKVTIDNYNRSGASAHYATYYSTTNRISGGAVTIANTSGRQIVTNVLVGSYVGTSDYHTSAEVTGDIVMVDKSYFLINGEGTITLR